MKIYTDLEASELKGALDIDIETQLQFTSQPPKDYCIYLNDLIADRNDIILRMYNYEGAFRDLIFLKDIPNIKKLKLDDPDIENVEVLKYLEDLQFLKICKTKKRNVGLDVLLNLKKLAALELDGQEDVLPLLKKQHHFKELYLTSINLEDLSLLKNQQDLEYLDLSNCKYVNHHFIGQCKNLKYLSLEKGKLQDINFIDALTNLEFLSLDSLEIKQLPSFAKCKRLKRIYLSKLSNLLSYAELGTAMNLEEFSIKNISTLDPNDFVFLEKRDSIKNILIDIKDKKTSRQLSEYIAATLGIYNI